MHKLPHNPKRTPARTTEESLDALHNLALLLKQQGRLSEAAAMYERALAIFEKSLRPTHPRLTTCRANYEKLQRQRRIFSS